MEIKIIGQTKKELEFEVIGEKTILNPLKYKLLENKNVSSADWRISHPLLANPRFYLRIKEGTPKTILLKAIRDLKKEFGIFRNSLEELKD